MDKKQRHVVGFICELLDQIDPSGSNSKLFTARCEKELRSGDSIEKVYPLRLEMPNMKSDFSLNRLRSLCEKLGVEAFHRLWRVDPITNQRYLTPEKFLILPLPVGRTQQTIEKKLSVAENDRTVDALTGQTVGSAKSSGLSNPEIQILYSRGLTATLRELVTIRGGNLSAYREFRSTLETAGTAAVDRLDPRSRTRTSVVLQLILEGMCLEANIVEDL